MADPTEPLDGLVDPRALIAAQDRLGDFSNAATSASGPAPTGGGDDNDLEGFEDDVGEATAPIVPPVPEAQVHSARGERVLYEAALADLHEVSVTACRLPMLRPTPHSTFTSPQQSQSNLRAALSSPLPF